MAKWNNKNQNKAIICFTCLAVLVAATCLVFLPNRLVLADTSSDLIDVTFQATPLFSEADILPGDSVSRAVNVFNKSGGTVTVSAAAQNIEDLYHLGDMMDLTVKKGEAIFFHDILSVFFAAGNIDLGPLPAGETGQYDFTASFASAAGNEYNTFDLDNLVKTMVFDIAVTAIAPELSGSGSGLFYASYFGGSSVLTGPSPSPVVLGEAGAPQLTIEKTVTPAETNPGEAVTYRIIVANNGSLDAFGVAVRDQLPAGLSFSANVAGAAEWYLGDIAPGRSETIIYDALVDWDARAGFYDNTAEASAINHEPVTAAAGLAVREIAVLGVEGGLVRTGFAPGEFSLLAGLIVLCAGVAGFLRRDGACGKTSLPNQAMYDKN